MSNLGNYQRIITFSKMVGGPVPLVVGIFCTGMVAGPIVKKAVVTAVPVIGTVVLTKVGKILPKILV